MLPLTNLSTVAYNLSGIVRSFVSKANTMSSPTVLRFGIRHILGGLVLTSIGMGLVSSKVAAFTTLGAIFLSIAIGGICALGMMFLSDLIDKRRVDDRRLISRTINGVGLLFVVITALLVLLLGLLFLFQLLLLFR